MYSTCLKTKSPECSQNGGNGLVSVFQRSTCSVAHIACGTWFAGGIIYVNLFGQPVIILNSSRLATEMLDKKSAIYSDRPRLVFGGEMVGWDQSLPLTPYGDRLREYRSLLHQFIGTRNQVKRFHSLSEVETRRFLERVLEKPDRVHDYIRQYVSCLRFLSRWTNTCDIAPRAR